MNKAIKNLTSRLEKAEIHYELTEDKNGVVFDLLIESIGVTVRYLVDTFKYDDGTYKFVIFTGGLIKVKNEYEILKTLNKINFAVPFINFFVSEEGKIHIKVESLDSEETLDADVIEFISSISNTLEENYDSIMKSNWT